MGGSEAQELARLRAQNARLLEAEKEWHPEREILRRAAACFAWRGEVSPGRWDFLSGNRADFGVKRICRVLGTSRAGYCRHLRHSALGHLTPAECEQRLITTRDLSLVA
nr:hypothetical protein [Streptomyces sp. REN17]